MQQLSSSVLLYGLAMWAFRPQQQSSTQVTQHNGQQLPRLTADVWAIIAQQVLEAERNDAHACARLSLVSKAWRVALAGVLGFPKCSGRLSGAKFPPAERIGRRSEA